MIEPAGGTLLIAEPFLKDPEFIRTVVLLCRHTHEEGSFGFTINKLFEHTIDELIDDLEGYFLPVYAGGPVATDTLHYVHDYPEYFPDAQQVCEGVYWGGDFDLMKDLIKNKTLDTSRIRFFLGYSGWGEGQLQTEMEEKSWLVTSANAGLIFNTPDKEIWNECLRQLGGKYKLMIHYPTDPQLN